MRGSFVKLGAETMFLAWFATFFVAAAAAAADGATFLSGTGAANGPLAEKKTALC